MSGSGSVPTNGSVSMSWLNAEFGRGLNLKDYAGAKLDDGTFAPTSEKGLSLNVFAGRTRWHGCSSGYDHVGNQCFPKCASGYTGANGTCYENCPAGMSDRNNPTNKTCNQIDVTSRKYTGYTTYCPNGTVDKGTECYTPDSWRHYYVQCGWNNWSWCGRDTNDGNNFHSYKANNKQCITGYSLINNQCIENCPSGYEALNNNTCYKPPYTYNKKTYSRPASVDTVP